MTIERTERTYFIASVRCREAKAIDGRIMAKEDELVWLGNQFSSKDEVKRRWMRWSGNPWWHKFKPDSLRIYRVTERHEREEIEV